MTPIAQQHSLQCKIQRKIIWKIIFFLHSGIIKKEEPCPDTLLPIFLPSHYCLLYVLPFFPPLLTCGQLSSGFRIGYSDLIHHLQCHGRQVVILLKIYNSLNIDVKILTIHFTSSFASTHFLICIYKYVAHLVVAFPLQESAVSTGSLALILAH